MSAFIDGDDLIGNESVEEADYVATTTVVTIRAGDTEYELNINIRNDERLEDNELLRITAIPESLPDNETSCTFDLIITDDDGKLLIYVCEILLLFT